MSLDESYASYAEAREVASRAGLELRDGATGLELVGPGGLSVSAAVERLRAPRPGTKDPLWRAVLSGKESVIDATAGLGGDAFHLASKGVKMTLIERSPVLAALLHDALRRAALGELGGEARAAAARITLLVGEANELLPQAATGGAGVVYLDPMFSAVDKRAAPPKGLALLRRLFAADGANAAADEALLRAARRAATRRVVVKRALKDKALAGTAPSGSLQGRTVRYDLYAPL